MPRLLSGIIYIIIYNDDKNIYALNRVKILIFYLHFFEFGELNQYYT